MLTQAQITFLTMALIPVYLFILSVIVLKPAKYLVKRYMKDGWLKRLLLARTN